MSKKSRKQIAVPQPEPPRPLDPRLIRIIAKLLRQIADELLRMVGA